MTFACRPNFKLTGFSRITCLNGAWSNKVPVCKGNAAMMRRTHDKLRASNRGNHSSLEHNIECSLTGGKILM